MKTQIKLVTNSLHTQALTSYVPMMKEVFFFKRKCQIVFQFFFFELKKTFLLKMKEVFLFPALSRFLALSLSVPLSPSVAIPTSRHPHTHTHTYIHPRTLTRYDFMKDFFSLMIEGIPSRFFSLARFLSLSHKSFIFLVIGVIRHTYTRTYTHACSHTYALALSLSLSLSFSLSRTHKEHTRQHTRIRRR